MKKIKNRQGFTLIEVVVVMAIIAVLALLVIGAITVARNTAKETAHRSNAKTLQSALEAYYAKNRNYTGLSNGTFAAVGTALSSAGISVTMTTTGVCTDTVWNDGGTVTFSTTAGSPAYVLNVAPASCGAAATAIETINGPNN